MKKKLRIAALIVAVVFVGLISFELGSRFHQTADSVEIIADTLSDNSEKKGEIVFEKKVSDIVIVDGFLKDAAVADESGFGILDEDTGVKMQITTDPAATVVFDGNKVYFVRRGIEDRTIVVRSRDNLYRDEIICDENGEPEVWEKGRICSYDLKTFQMEELFDTNGFNACVVYADEDYLYYTDYADENVGWRVGDSQLVAPTLFRYDLNKETSEVISAYASKVGTVGSVIVYTDSDAASYRHDTWFYGGGLHFYDTVTKTDCFIAGDSEFLYAEGKDYYYATIIGASSAKEDPASHPVTYVNRCSINGENSSEVKRIDGAWEHHVGPYLEFNGDAGYKIYNALSDNMFDSEYWYNHMSADGQLISLSTNEPGSVNSVSENGEEVPLYDVSDLLPNDDYYTTSIFDENGIYCKCTGEDCKYCFIPWKAEQTITKEQAQSSEKSEITWKNPGVTDITSSDATINVDISFSHKTICTECGFYIGTSISNLDKNVRYDLFFRSIGPGGIQFFFNLKKYGQILKSGTTYYYMIYIKDKSGNEFTSEVKSFTTR